MDAFILMKNRAESIEDKEGLPYRRIKMTRLILAGPDPKFVSDDPEGNEVLKELIETYKGVSPELQEDIALLLLPMDNQKNNALIVNALQRAVSIIVQNSIQEGFGLTATEAMWKGKCVLVSGAAGLVHQVQHDQTGKINPDPRDIESLAATMELMLNSPLERNTWGFNAQVRVIQNYTLFSQLYHWLTLWARIKKAR